MNILVTLGLVVDVVEKEWVKATPLRASESIVGVFTVLSVPKHLSALRASTIRNKIFGFIGFLSMHGLERARTFSRS